ncbi:hypothetical protein IFM89_024487 [Coptis chinensis]|uniref:Rx N-terminal domain-containing protein n=1 Tax=Coptis chinensis TaxID=261450 RepID=A0A835H7E2_9MAGN|nr:hypothetical protein IFM89_024487 [Coptis chinensis]
MAEVVVSPIVDFILPKLTSLIGTDSRLPNDLKNDLKKVSKTFSIIRLVLDDAEKKQIKDKSIRSWLRMVKDAAYEAEDIIDDCALEFYCPESEIAAYEAEDIIDEEFHCPESEKTRHVSVTYDSAPSQATLNTIFKSQSFCRTILFQHCATSSLLELFVSRLSQLEYLRVLDLSKLWTLSSLPSIFGRLKHLRYLNLSNMNIASLPKSVCNLRNLQILVLSYNLKLTTLPPSIGNLKQLRCLDLYQVGIMVLPESICCLTNLQSLNLQKCRNLKMLPKNLSKMRKLRKLVIGSELYIGININDPMLTHMPMGIGELTCLKQLRSSTALPKLTQLGLYNMPNVEGWSSECLLFPSCLQRLHLYNCPKLKLPTPLPSSITRLSVGKGNDTSLKSVEKLPNLSHLRITEFDEVETLPEAPLRNLTRLQVLEISNCDKLKRLPTELENLSGLIIWRCRGLESLTEGLRNLTSLKELRITTCGSLKSLSESSLQHLTALQMLRIWACPKLEIMSVDFHHLISLRDLELRLLPQLTSLPEEIQHARRLQTLDIRDCKNLRKLPEWLLELPALTLLRVVKCHPELHRRCEDWSRIPLLRVENRVEL